MLGGSIVFSWPGHIRKHSYAFVPVLKNVTKTSFVDGFLPEDIFIFDRTAQPQNVPSISNVEGRRDARANIVGHIKVLCDYYGHNGRFIIGD